jgi:hypothetical protein
MFPPSYYSQRAAEVEAMAKGITDLTTREMCLELAQRFRDIANMKSLTQQSDIEVMHLAERAWWAKPRALISNRPTIGKLLDAASGPQPACASSYPVSGLFLQQGSSVRSGWRACGNGRAAGSRDMDA